MDPYRTAEAIYFLLPLPQAIPLPDKAAFTFSGPPSIDSFHMTSEMGGEPPMDWYVSIAHHHAPSSMELFEQLRELASEVMPWAYPKSPVPGRNSTAPGRRSVVEACVIQSIRKEDPQEYREAALLLAIECVNTLLRTAHLTTRAPQQLLSRALLPPVLPGAVAIVSDGPPLCQETFGHVNARSAALRGEDQEVSEDTFSTAWSAVRETHPLLRYVDLMREARWAAEGEENYWSAIVTMSAAGEFLLTTILQLLVWEEGATPSEALRHFPANQEIGSRLTALEKKLGGNWNGKGVGSVGTWMSHVAHKRNAALHQAQEVSGFDAATAFEASIGLEQYIAERLVAEKNLARFPRSALALIGSDGLKGRGHMTARVREALSTLPTYFERFERWRGALSAPHTATPPDDTERELLAVITPTGHLYWVLAIPELRVACPASLVSKLPAPQEESLRAIQRALSINPPRLPISSWVEGGADLATPSGRWRPHHELLPLHETLVSGEDVARSLQTLSPDEDFAQASFELRASAHGEGGHTSQPCTSG